MMLDFLFGEKKTRVDTAGQVGGWALVGRGGVLAASGIRSVF